jgi:hypothetical protein
VPKDAEWSEVRLVHDGTNGVTINNRIRPKDRMRFPLIDDLEAVVNYAMERKHKKRMTLLYDVRGAHRLCPVHEDDWGLQAFSLEPLDPGETGQVDHTRLTEDLVVYFNTVGTFGITSAGYFLGRVSACMHRAVSYFIGADYEFFHLLFADDGKLLSLGNNCRDALLLALFIIDLFEIPLAWHKVRGGVEAQWIGYEVDWLSFRLGVSASKVAWTRAFVEKISTQGGARGSDWKEGLGRLSFVAGALQHLRPFLGPIFAWVSILSKKTFAAPPLAISLFLWWFVRELQQEPLRFPLQPQRLGGELFRVDAKAEGDLVVVGGWEVGHSGNTKEARWFSIQLDRRSAPWIYVKGEPYRIIATLELLATLLAVMIFGDSEHWKCCTAGGTLPLAAIGGTTDSQVNAYVIDKFMTTKSPMCFVLMELSLQLRAKNLSLELAWVPRAQNVQADALTNFEYGDFDLGKQMHIDFSKLEFIILFEALEKAGTLDSEINLAKTSRAAKGTACMKEPMMAIDKKLRIREPW